MVQRKIVTKVPLKKLDEQLAKDFEEAQNHLNKVQGAIISKVKSSDIGQYALHTARNQKVAYDISNGYMTLTFEPSVDFTETPTQDYVNLDPKTVNTLLTGKLLKDSEKRRLIQKLIRNTGILDDEPAS